MTMTHPNEVSTRVNFALRTRTGGGGDRDPFIKNLSMLCETCRGRLCVMYLLNDRWYTHWERQETAGFVLPMNS